MKKGLLCACTAAAASLLSVTSLYATPYASGITNDAGTISFVLNENASSVQVVFNNGSSTNDLGARTKGIHSFTLGSATNYQIVVRNSIGNGFTHKGNPTTVSGITNSAGVLLTNDAASSRIISADTNTWVHFTEPRGVAVNRNPKSPYFGRIYVANAVAGTTTNVVRFSGDGIYMLKADQTDAIGQGDTALTGGLDFSGGGTGNDVSPRRIHVGQDDNLYICDWSDAAGNLYVSDPNVSPASGQFALKAFNGGSAVVPIGDNNNHGSLMAVHVLGSQITSNLVIYTVDEDMQANRTTTTRSQLNSIWRYDVGAGVFPHTAYANARTFSPSGSGSVKDTGIGWTYQDSDLDRGALTGTLYYTDHRSNGGESGLIVRTATGGARWTSLNSTTNLYGVGINDVLRDSWSVAVSPNERFCVVMKRTDGRCWILPLTNSTPDLSKRTYLSAFSAGGAGQAISFDAAGNLYAVNEGYQLLRIFSPGGNTTAITSGDASGANGAFKVHEAITITYQPSSVTNYAGNNASFAVYHSGAASTFRYQWYFNDAVIASQTNAVLIRTNIQLNTLAGYYKVVISNDYYAATSAVAALVVTDGPPVITVQPVNRDIGAGSNTTFTVSTVGTDARAYQWRLNGTNIMGATTTSLARNNVQQWMTGSYECIVSNIHGTITTDMVNLSVTDMGPVMSTQPVSRTVAAGSNVTFTVASPGGTDPRTYTWMFNGGPIEGATNTSLVITNAQVNNNGDYSVKIVNSIGEVTSSNAVLTVTNTPVVFITQPASRMVGAGSNVTFSATAFGDATVTYQWYINGNLIDGATSNTFVWINAQTNDTGTNFSVTIANDTSGPLSSSNAILTVTNRSPLIVLQPTNEAASVGGSATLSVQAQGQNPLSYQWRRGTNEISGQTGSSMTLSGLQLSDAALDYNVVVSNSFGSVTSANTQIAVVVSSTAGSGAGLNAEYFASQYLSAIPVTNGFISLVTNATVTRQENIDHLYGTNSPDPTMAPDYFIVRWTGQIEPLFSQDYTFSTVSDDGIRLWINGKLLIDQWKSGAQNHSVIVSNLVANQKYDIRVEYVEITGSGEAHLFWASASQIRTPVPLEQLYPLSGPYIISVNPTNLVMNAGESVSGAFTVAAGGDNISGYQWLHNGTNISGATTPSLDLNNVQVSDAGNYTVIVTGSLGSITSSFPAVLTVSTTTTPGTGTGVVGEYFTQSTETSAWYSKTPLTRIDPSIDFNWGMSSSDIAISANTNVVRWTGRLEPLYSQFYTFQSVSDDGFRLWIDNQLIIDRWVAGSTNANTVVTNMPYAFVAGQKYDIRVEYFERSSTSEAHLYWWSASQPRQAIAPTQLYPEISPFFATEPANITAVASNNFTWTVYTGGTGPVTYQWKKNGSDIPGATNSALTLTPALPGDAGDYSLAITNALGGRVSTNGTLAIEFAPYITQHPQSVSGTIGGPATFTVSAGGSATLSYQWRFNGTNITGAVNTSYTITNIAAGDLGNYSVIVINSYGSATSTDAPLTVGSDAPDFGAPAILGSNLILNWSSIAGRNYQVQFKADLNVAEWTTIPPDITATGNSLSFTNGIGSGQGYYRVILLP